MPRSRRRSDAVATQAAKKSPSSPLDFLSNQYVIYGLIAFFLLLYFITGVWMIGLLIGLCIVWIVVLEFAQGTREHGLKNEVKETLIALALALIVWFGAGVVLNTSSPLNAIVSCSMLPHIARGDMVVLSGDRVQAQQEEVASLAGISRAQVYENGAFVADVNGSMYTYCATRQSAPACQRFISSPGAFTEKHGELLFAYEKCGIVMDKGRGTVFGPCVSYLEVNGRRYGTNLSNDVVVYQPGKNEYYSRVGDIIHRAYIRLHSADDGKTYFLTKGDNNPIFDIQVYDEASGQGNAPVELQRSKGRILVSVPYLGYFKLFISPAAIPTPEGCDRHYAKWDAAQ